MPCVTLSALSTSPHPSMHELPRKLGLLDATALIVGIVIGSGIFVLPNLIARELPSAPAILSVWIIAGILSFFGALAYAELGAMMPATGGLYIYLREAYGPLCAFVGGWTFMLAVISGGAAWLAVTFSIYLAQFFPLTPGTSKAISLALVAVLSVVNLVGVREGAWVQRIFTLFKVVGLVVLIGAALLRNHPQPHAQAKILALPFTWNHFGVAMAACLMAYNGWSFVSFIAGEVKEPKRNLFWSLVLGMTAVSLLYVFANVAYLNVLPVSVIAASDRVGADVATHLMGPFGGTFVALVVLLSIVGAINGCIFTAARIPFAQARDGLFFERFGRVHPSFQTPAFAIVASGSWTALLILTGSYETLYSYSILAAWIFYTLSVVALWILRRRMPDHPRPYKMWGYPYTLWAFVLVSIWFIGNAIASQPRPSIMALLIIASGAVAYSLWRRPNEKTNPMLRVRF